MSKAKDRARAESGMIFRNGSFVNKDEWYAAHPTPSMLKARQREVDSAVQAMMVEKTKASAPHRYYCTACRRYHTQDSKVGKEHTNFYLAED